MNIIHWIHHLFNPHCLECRYETEGDKVCQSCETLKLQLSVANDEKRRMLEALLEKPKPIEVTTGTSNPEQLRPRAITWNVRKQMLEAEDRRAAEILRKKEEEKKKVTIPSGEEGVLIGSTQSIEELEKELGVQEDAKSSNVHG